MLIHCRNLILLYLFYKHRLTGRGTVEFNIEKGDGSAFSPQAGGEPRKTATIQVRWIYHCFYGWKLCLLDHFVDLLSYHYFYWIKWKFIVLATSWCLPQSSLTVWALQPLIIPLLVLTDIYIEFPGKRDILCKLNSLMSCSVRPRRHSLTDV